MAKEFTDFEIQQIRTIAKEEAALEAKRVADELRLSAFVDGDATLHKAMQQANLDSGKFWREIWARIIITMVGTGAGVTVSFVIYSVLSAIKSELKK